MARLLFPDAASVDRVQATAGTALLSAAGATAVVYLDEAGTQLADIQTPAGVAVTGASLVLDSLSRIPKFLGPTSGTSTLHVRVDGGAPLEIEASNAGVAATASDALTAAEAAQATAAGKLDATVASQTYALIRADRAAKYDGQALVAYGNSYVFGVGAPTEAERFANIVAARTGMALVNRGVSATRTHDTAQLVAAGNGAGISAWSGSAAGGVILCSTLNGARRYGSTAPGLRLEGSTVQTVLENLMMEVKVEQTTFTFTGTWTDGGVVTGYRPSGLTSKLSSTAGDYYEFQVIGDVCTVYSLGFDTTKTLSVKFSVDGVDFRTVEQGSRVPASSGVFALVSERLSGMGDGLHTVRVTRVSGNAALYADFVTVPRPTPPPVVIVPALNLTAEGYAAYSPDNLATDAVLVDYNRLTAGVARRYPHVRVAQIAWNPATMLDADLVHPNALGHAAIAEGVVAAFEDIAALTRLPI